MLENRRIGGAKRGDDQTRTLQIEVALGQTTRETMVVGMEGELVFHSSQLGGAGILSSKRSHRLRGGEVGPNHGQNHQKRRVDSEFHAFRFVLLAEAKRLASDSQKRGRFQRIYGYTPKKIPRHVTST